MKVVVDTDPATGYFCKDVDDGLALLYLLALPDEFDITGISTVFGNASLGKTTKKAHEVLRIARREDVPVFPGASNKRQLGKETQASEFLLQAASVNPGEISILALGPLTNIATAGLHDAGFFSRVSRIVIMGGALEEGFGIPLVSPLEFNFFADPAAADSVLEAPCEKVLISADLCRQAVFTQRELDSLWNMDSGVSTYLAYRIKPWLRLNLVAPFLPWKGGFVPWDVVAAVYLRRPDLLSESVKKGLRLRHGRFTTGAVEEDENRSGSPVKIPTRLEPRMVLDEFLLGIGRFSGNILPE